MRPRRPPCGRACAQARTRSCCAIARQPRVEVILHPLSSEQQTVNPAARNRLWSPPATLLDLTARLPDPSVPTLGPGDDLLGVELKRLGGRLRLRAARLISIAVLGSELLPGLAEELAPPLPSPQLLGQLLPTRVPIQLILSLIDRLRLGQNLPRDLPEITVRAIA